MGMRAAEGCASMIVGQRGSVRAATSPGWRRAPARPWRRCAGRYFLVRGFREEIIATLQLPDNVQLCRSHLDIPIPYRPLWPTYSVKLTRPRLPWPLNWPRIHDLPANPASSLAGLHDDRRRSDLRAAGA